MMLLSLSACYLVNKNDATVTSLFSQLLLSVNKNDATVTFSLLLSQ